VRTKSLSGREQRVPCAARTLPDDYNGLLASLPSRFRTSLRSTRKRLGEAFAIEFGRHDDPEEFSSALETLYRNHASRWAAKDQAGVFVSEKKRRFYSLLTGRLHDAGALRFYYLKLNGLIVAQEYCFRHGDTLYLLQEGFDFAFQKENVGNMLRAMVFEQIIGEGMRIYDFLAGVSRHKKTWSDHFPEDVCFEIARDSLKARSLQAAPLLAMRLRAMLRKALKRGQPEGA
jgi:CelD/BcsL family acetyltransferase involved in cellulose biosynthesis